jgi:hypothetical protein
MVVISLLREDPVEDSVSIGPRRKVSPQEEKVRVAGDGAGMLPVDDVNHFGSRVVEDVTRMEVSVPKRVALQPISGPPCC